MAVGSAQRREERRPRVAAAFGADAEAALDLLHLADLAWQGCYPGDLAVDPRVLDDVLLCANGDLAWLVRMTLSGVIDFRDGRMAADAVRARRR